MHILSVIVGDFGPFHLRSGDALPYLALAYAVFFCAIFAYVLSLSRRQGRVQNDLVLLRQALDEEMQRAARERE